MAKTYLKLNDHRRSRQFLTDIYLPKLPTPAPLIIVSHGLGSECKSFASLAQHLVSHGFAIAVLEHPGSDSQQLRYLLSGAAKELIESSQLIDRPLDVSYLLDELQRLSQTKSLFPSRLNLQQIGMLGHSVGGYTALALAGAEINFVQLRQVCHFKSENMTPGLANISLLLQCLALNLPSRANASKFCKPYPVRVSIFSNKTKQLPEPLSSKHSENKVRLP